MIERYWIKVFFEDGTELEKESPRLNYVYDQLSHYQRTKWPAAQLIQCGRGDDQTSEWNKTQGIVF